MRYVVEYPAEDVVVGELEKRTVQHTHPPKSAGAREEGQCPWQQLRSRAYVYENLAEHEDDQVVRAVQIVEGSVFPQSIAGSKQHRADRVQSDELEAVVTAGLGRQEARFWRAQGDGQILVLTNTARYGQRPRRQTRRRRRPVLPCWGHRRKGFPELDHVNGKAREPAACESPLPGCPSSISIRGCEGLWRAGAKPVELLSSAAVKTESCFLRGAAMVFKSAAPSTRHVSQGGPPSDEASRLLVGSARTRVLAKQDTALTRRHPARCAV